MFEYVDQQLKHWANWVHRGGSNTVARGYPSHSVEGRCIKQGGLVGGTGVNSQIDDDVEAERMDMLLARLGMRHPEPATVVRTWYLSTDSDCKFIARKMKVSPATIKTWRRIGLSWLDGKLDEITLYKVST